VGPRAAVSSAKIVRSRLYKVGAYSPTSCHRAGAARPPARSAASSVVRIRLRSLSGSSLRRRARDRSIAAWDGWRLIHTAVSFALFFLTTLVERRLNAALLGACSTEKMQDCPLRVSESLWKQNLYKR